MGSLAAGFEQPPPYRRRDRELHDPDGPVSRHPVGSSGARIVLTLATILKRENAQRGVATICIGGGQGGAMLIENVSEVIA